MDQVKIGGFIARCRKEKNMTQRQLADLLGISDKAVSKWETGRGLPEAGCMTALCEALGISVNELLTGERIPSGKYQEKAEETMVVLTRMIQKKAEETMEALAQVKSEAAQAKKEVARIGKGVEEGVGFGAVLAMVISYHTYSSVGWAIVHGILGWIYVVYYLIKY